MAGQGRVALLEFGEVLLDGADLGSESVCCLSLGGGPGGPHMQLSEARLVFLDGALPTVLMCGLTTRVS